MSWVKVVLGGLFTLFVLGVLGIYWFAPFSSPRSFVSLPENGNFSINSSNSSGMQFYPNMRYSSANISYNINKTQCSLQRQGNMKEAFQRIENITLLRFYPTDSNAEIRITCKNDIIVNKTYFIAGEGGPVNITKSGAFNVIEKGEVLLLRDSNCPLPNVATHELLHALGFDHSKNPGNVMYPVSSCNQVIGDDIPALINSLYSYPTLPDLSLGNTSAILHGRYIDANVTIENQGLAESGESVLVISADNKTIKQENVPSLQIGAGITFQFTNLLAPLTVKSIEFSAQMNSSELEKNNNQRELFLRN